MKKLPISKVNEIVGKCLTKGTPVDVHVYPYKGNVPSWVDVPVGFAAAYKCYVCAVADLYFWNIDVYSSGAVTTYSIPSEFLSENDMK